MQIVAGPDLTASQLYELLTLRVDVFVVEQNCPYQETDGQDLLSSTEHLWFSDSIGITAALRILAHPAGRKIGRVATRGDRRGSGLASQLMDAALIHLGPVEVYLDAQTHLRSFYERLGFALDGDEFSEDDIPHLPMKRVANMKVSP